MKEAFCGEMGNSHGGGSRATEQWGRDRDGLRRGMRELGLQPTGKQIEQLIHYDSMILKWNRAVGLVSKKDEGRLVTQHLLPCLATLAYIPEEVRAIVDVGSGAGLPGIPLKIARPELELTLIEAKSKKVLFLKEVVSKLSLAHTVVLHGRAEEIGGEYPFIVTRGVGQLRDVLRVCAPLLKPEGTLMVFKGHRDPRETSAATEMLAEIGTAAVGSIELVFPLTSKAGRLLFFRKVSRET